jgi:2-polyprenyl-3-methyl-5-hydroxy-6-metoxy-1,4-benzoquinol methylase
MSTINITTDDVEKELKIQLTDQQKKYFNNKMTDKYSLPSSNQQISTILSKLNRPHVYYRLCLLLCKFKQTWDFPTHINMLLSNKKSNDIDIYEAVFKNSKDIGSVSDYSKDYLASYIVKIFRNLNLDPKSLLDIGCGNCILTRDLGNALRLESKDVYGADIPTEFEQGWANARPKEVNFVEILNNKLKFDRKFDLITCMMVLHHVPTEFLNQYILDIFNLLNQGGIFMIKEHDCFNAVDYMIADIEHSLYIAKEEFAIQMTKNKSSKNLKLSDKAKKAIFDQKINYYDRFTWKILMQRVGFTCLYEEPFDTGLSNSYGPNRGYIAVFTKN